MAKTRFDPAFNSEIYRTVKSFNQKAKRAEARGLSNVPDIVSIAKLKARYTTKEDMKIELDRLRKFNNNPTALNKVSLGYNTKITEWELGYIKDSLEDVKNLYDVMIIAAKERYKSYPENYALRTQLNNLEVRRQYLNRNIYDLTRSELKTFRTYIDKYKDYGTRDNQFYDTYLEAFNALLQQSGVDKAVARKLRQQLNSLTPQEFLELYNTYDEFEDLFNELQSPAGLKRVAQIRRDEARKKFEEEEQKVEQSDQARFAKWKAKGWKEDPETGQWYDPKTWIRGSDGMWYNPADKSNWKLSSGADTELINQKVSQVAVLMEERIQNVQDRLNIKMPKNLTPSQKRQFLKFYGKKARK